MCSCVYLKNFSNLGVCEEVAALLEAMRRDRRFGNSEILTREEAAKREHLYGGFSSVIETDGHTTFGNAWVPPYAAPLTNCDYRFGHAPMVIAGQGSATGFYRLRCVLPPERMDRTCNALQTVRDLCSRVGTGNAVGAGTYAVNPARMKNAIGIFRRCIF